MKLIEKQYDIKLIESTNSLEISLEARILIKYILEFIFEASKKKEDLIKAVQEDKYNELKNIHGVMNYLNYHPILKSMKDDLWNILDAKSLAKIANNEPFKIKSWGDNHDELLIPIEVLRSFSSYSDTFSKSDPKGLTAQKLGAKLV